MKHLQCIVLVLLCSTALHFGNAQVPRNLSYQGVLTDSVGTPKPDGSYSFTFRLYESLSGGSPVGTQAQPLNVKRGLFHTVLDQVLNGLSLDRPYWLGIQVGSDPELSPRIPLTSVPYSLAADSARIAGTIPNNAVSSSKLQDGAVTSAKISDGTIQRLDVATNFKAPRADTADYALVGTMSGSAGGDLSGSYPNPTIAANVVTSGKIQDGAVATVDIADNAITSSKISDGSVSTADIADNSVTSTKILNGTIQFSDIGQNGAATGQVMKWNGSAWVPASDTAGTAGPWQTSGSTVFYSGGFVGVGRSTPLTPAEYFGIRAPVSSGYGGMYIQTQGAASLPFYGYSTPSAAAWTYLDGNDGNKWKLFNSGDQLTVDPLGNIGIGTTSPAHKLDISGPGIIRARVNSDNNAGLALTLNGQPGWSLATVGSGQFQVFNDAIGQNALWIDATTNSLGIGTTSPTYKLHALDTAPTDVPAVYGEHAVDNFYGIGVKGVGGYKGVEGIVTTSSSSVFYGVRGEVNSSGAGGTKYGVYGTVTGTSSGNKVAVGGEVNSGVGIGVSGTVTANDVNSVGVYGYAQPLGRAVYANGNLVVSGAKLFQIDHPLDPANKMLNHYCTEGPEPLNVYSGTVNLDGTGAAWITLPEYFQSINKDFRYQLTPVGASMPDLYVAEEIQGNSFKIGGGKAGSKVSWQVSATRNDLYIQRAGITAEVEKSGEERGKYLVPELFGQPETMGIFWRDRSAPRDKSNDTK